MAKAKSQMDQVTRARFEVMVVKKIFAARLQIEFLDEETVSIDDLDDLEKLEIAARLCQDYSCSIYDAFSITEEVLEIPENANLRLYLLLLEMGYPLNESQFQIKGLYDALKIIRIARELKVLKIGVEEYLTLAQIRAELLKLNCRLILTTAQAKREFPANSEIEVSSAPFAPNSKIREQHAYRLKTTSS